MGGAFTYVPTPQSAAPPPLGAASAAWTHPAKSGIWVSLEGRGSAPGTSTGAEVPCVLGKSRLASPRAEIRATAESSGVSVPPSRVYVPTSGLVEASLQKARAVGTVRHRARWGRTALTRGLLGASTAHVSCFPQSPRGRRDTHFADAW